MKLYCCLWLGEAFLIALSICSAGAQVVPTDRWVNFWSDSSFVNGRPLPPGAVVRAYDPQDVLCGEFTVTIPASYGLMPVYGDDPTTPGLDEGAEPGDTISFTIDGVPVVPIGPSTPVWTANGDLRKVHLWRDRVITTEQWVVCWSDNSTTRCGATEPFPVGAIVRAYDPQGTLCGADTVLVAGRYGPMRVYADNPSTALDEGAEQGDSLLFNVILAGSELPCTAAGPDQPVWSLAGDSLHIDLTACVATELLTAEVRYRDGRVEGTWTLSEWVEPRDCSVWRGRDEGLSSMVPLNCRVGNRGLSYWFEDSDVEGGYRYRYQVRIIGEGRVRSHDLGSVYVAASSRPALSAAPNPFAKGTWISVAPSSQGPVRLLVYDIGGRVVRSFDIRPTPARRTYSVFWEGDDDHAQKVPSGVYFVRLSGSWAAKALKLIVVR